MEQVTEAQDWLTAQRKHLPFLLDKRKELLKEKRNLEQASSGTNQMYLLIAKKQQNDRSLKRIEAEIEMYQNSKHIIQDLKKKNTINNNNTSSVKIHRKKRKIVLSEDDMMDIDEDITTSSQKIKEVMDYDSENDKHLLAKYYCQHCQLPLSYLPNECKLVCSECGINRDYVDVCSPLIIINTDRNSHDTNGYERHTHEFDVIEPFRLQPDIEIDPSVYTLLQKLIRQNRFGLSKNLTFAKVGSYLRFFKLKHLYKAKNQIGNTLNNITRPQMTPAEESKIVLSFLKLQPRYEMIKKTVNESDYNNANERSSFLAYSFTTFHICRYNQLHQFTPFLKLLKVEKCQRQQVRLLAQALFDALNTPYVVHIR